MLPVHWSVLVTPRSAERTTSVSTAALLAWVSVPSGSMPVTEALLRIPSPLIVELVGWSVERVVTTIVKTASSPTARSVDRVQVTVPP